MIDFSQIDTLYLDNNEVQQMYLNGSKVWEKIGGLKFTANQANSSVYMNKAANAPSLNLEYSTDNGETWSQFVNGTTNVILQHEGDTVLIRAGANGNSTIQGGYDSDTYSNSFRGTGDLSVSGNILYLLNRDTSQIQSIPQYCFLQLFASNTAITDASQLDIGHLVYTGSHRGLFYGCSNLVVPPKVFRPLTMVEGAYGYMFAGGCVSLKTSPEILAQSGAANAYEHMFDGCTALTSPPSILRGDIAYQRCFDSMFINCTSLVSSPTLPATTLSDYCYQNMFYGCTNLTSAPALPATTLSSYCYQYMFQGCTALTSAPELPATTLASNCYSNMFRGCTSLTTAPELPAYNLPRSAYSYMFYGCTSLTTPPSRVGYSTGTQGSDPANWMFYGCTSLTIAPALPATSLGLYGYNNMFNGCTSLTSAPTLPATTLTSNCYESMFKGCTSLTTTPALPATTLAGSCYENMFNGCTSLTSAPTLPATTLTSNCYESMFKGCTSLTTTPALPATTLASSCYSNMFNGCTNLTSTPTLPATTLTTNCYQSMFQGCTSLTTTPALPATTLSNYCYQSMFNGCTNLTSAPVLPATTLSNYCYQSMFGGCTRLTTPPALPATTLYISCYYGMFYGCTNLTSAPALPATTLSSYCYQYMFQGCTALTSAPELPATILQSRCYSYMFQGCTSLTTAPELPATTLTYACYGDMFNGCTSLTSAPTVLPATTLDEWCYASMFKGCTSLTSAPVLRATNLPNNCYDEIFSGCSSLNEIEIYYLGSLAFNNWVYRVASSGTFYYDGTDTTTGTSAIPSGWTVKPTRLVRFKTDINGSTIKLEANGSAPSVDLKYSTNLINWNTYTVGDTITLTNTGDEVWFKAGSNGNSAFATSTSNYNKFVMTGSISASGSIMYLLDENGSDSATMGNYCFANLFNGCTALTVAPKLPATTLAYACYGSMFAGCTNLTQAPTLSATTLAEQCYADMFWGCTSLTKAPVLPATTLAEGCYIEMFKNCSSMNEIKIAYTGDFSGTGVPQHAFSNWVDGVAASGTLYYEGSDTTTGTSAIPTGWTVKIDWITKPLTFIAREANSTVSMASSSGPSVSLQYSTDDGQTWNTFTVGSTTVTLANIGDSVCFKATTTNTRMASSYNTSYNYFVMTGSIDASGNINSLLNGNNMSAVQTAPMYAYVHLFDGCSALVDASNLILASTTISQNSYGHKMFYNCINLVNGPEIRALNLITGNWTAEYMFQNCSSLQSVKVYDTNSSWNSISTGSWMQGVSSSGTFYYNGPVTTRGASYIPTGWTVQTFTA